MTNQGQQENPIWLEGFRRAWKQLTIARGEAEGNSQLLSGLTELLYFGTPLFEYCVLFELAGVQETETFTSVYGSKYNSLSS